MVFLKSIPFVKLMLYNRCAAGRYQQQLPPTVQQKTLREQGTILSNVPPIPWWCSLHCAIHLIGWWEVVLLPCLWLTCCAELMCSQYHRQHQVLTCTPKTGPLLDSVAFSHKLAPTYSENSSYQMLRENRSRINGLHKSNYLEWNRTRFIFKLVSFK